MLMFLQESLDVVLGRISSRGDRGRVTYKGITAATKALDRRYNLSVTSLATVVPPRRGPSDNTAYESIGILVDRTRNDLEAERISEVPLSTVIFSQLGFSRYVL
jgi:hypothetical protein